MIKPPTPKFDYVALATNTLSTHYHADKVPIQQLIDRLQEVAEACATLDRVKKALFYGKTEMQGRVEIGKAHLEKIDSLLPEEESRNRVHDLIHGIVGIATEAGELAEALMQALRDGTPIDLVNIVEEIGDTKWYMAVLATVVPFKWGDDERLNIAKLTSRYPEGFGKDAAVIRDLEKERQILEGKTNGGK
jgi:NTP pyrophosphatase (non-canonical NTP hydrolase)